MINRLRKICKAIFTNSTIDFDSMNGDSRLVDDIALNSISMLLLAIAIEEEFTIELSSEEASKCVTVNDILAIIEKELKG